MRVILADGRVQVRSALRLALDQEPGIVVTGEAATPREVLELVQREPADLILLDWELPGVRSVHLVPVLRSVVPELKIIVLSGRPEAREQAMAAGADIFICKGGGPQELLDVLRLAAVED